MIRLLLIPLAIGVLLALLVAILIDRSDDTAPVQVVTTSATTAPPLEPAHTTGPDVTMPTTTTTAAAVLVPRARTAPTAVHVGDMPALIRSGFARFGADVAEQAVRVSYCETGETFDPTVTGHAGERGLFQLHPVHRGWIDARGFGWDRMWEPTPNIAAAAALYEQEGWQPWTCRSAA